MATITFNSWLDNMLGNEPATHERTDVASGNIDASLLDATDANGGTALTASNVQDYDDVDQPDVVATTDLTVSSVTDGVVTLSGAATFSMVSAGADAADYLIVFQNSGTPSTSPLMIVWDSASTGLPVTPNGGDITATWTTNILVTIA